MRLSTTTETRISACSWVGSSSQLRAARCQEASERTSSGLAAVVPFSSGVRPQARSPASTRRLIASACSTSPSPCASPCRAIALSTSDPGVASRRATLPSASQAKGTSSGPTSATARSISRRVSASTTTECTAAMRSGSARARCSATIVGRSSRIACASASTVGARAIAARR